MTIFDSHSAGGVIIGPNQHIAVVSQKGKTWSLPKGHLDLDETPLEAAKREIFEETGIRTLELIKELGSYYRYKIGKKKKNDKGEYKKITLFLFRTSQTTLTPQDPKHPEAIWVRPEQVIDYLTHEKDKAFFASILEDIMNV